MNTQHQSHTITHSLFDFNRVREPQADCQAAQTNRTSQSLSAACGFPNARTKWKHGHTTLYKSNSG